MGTTHNWNRNITSPICVVVCCSVRRRKLFFRRFSIKDSLYRMEKIANALLMFCLCRKLLQPVTSSNHIRLADGKTPNEGRVEILVQGVWGTVCNSGWDMRDANVVCRMLNYKGAIRAVKNFSRGSGPIWLTRLECVGPEMDILNCPHDGLGQTSSCTHDYDAGVICHSYSGEMQVRLVGGRSPYSGRVEVKFNSTWGTICGGWSWDINDAYVVCRMLGYQRAIAGIKKFGGGRGKVWLEYVHCRGWESSLEQCNHNGWGRPWCSHDYDAGVICDRPGVEGPNVAVRLVGGPTPNQGRVEVRYYGVWGTVCKYGWGLADAHVVCRMLNYSKASWAGTATVKGSGPALMVYLRCRGSETSIEKCRHYGWGGARCKHWNDAGAVCQSHREDATVRLVGEQTHYGRAEVRYNGTWRQICDDTWDISDAYVVCRMLGYKAALAAIKRFSEGKVGLWMGGVECSGEETSISECYHRGWTNTGCIGRRFHAGVMCQTIQKTPQIEVRLEEGSSLNSGRVAVRYGKAWGTVCNRGLDINDAKVICRMLGYSEGVSQYTSKPGKGIIWLMNLKCNGTEKSIADCRHPGWGQTTCSHDNDAAVVCRRRYSTEELPLNEPRIIGTQKHYGRVELRNNKTWIPVCDDTWDILDAHVICRMLGYKAALAAIKRFRFGREKHWVSGVGCNGDERSFSECSHRGWTNTKCQGNTHAGVLCKISRDFPPVQVRLEGGNSPHSGRVAVRYGNVWGTICNRGLDINDAKVICRMLGYPGTRKVYPKSTYRTGNGTIWLSNLACKGTEKSIADCRHPGWGQTTCNHDEDAVIVCEIEERKEVRLDQPNFFINGSNAITVSTVVIVFNDTQRGDLLLNRVYQIAVERIRKEKWLRSSRIHAVAHFVFNEVNITMATEMGNASYITAVVPGPLSSITIGDGQYYHGYYNAPLEPGSMYRVHVRIVTMAMDGREPYGDSAFVTFTTKSTDKVPSIEGKGKTRVAGDNNESVVIALSLVIIFLVVVIVVIVWYFLKRIKAERNVIPKVEMKGFSDAPNEKPDDNVEIFGVRLPSDHSEL